MRFSLFLAFLLAAGCTARNHYPDLTGTYRAASPVRGMSAPDVALQLTSDKAILHTGSSELAAAYSVSDGVVYLESGAGRVGFLIINRDTLRYTDAAGNALDYVRGN